MTTFFVSRHPGAAEWAEAQGLAVDSLVAHLDPAEVGVGDTVIGTLPVNLAAAVCSQGARYVHLTLDLPPGWRGRELAAADMTACRARLEPYHITRAAT